MVYEQRRETRQQQYPIHHNTTQHATGQQFPGMSKPEGEGHLNAGRTRACSKCRWEPSNDERLRDTQNVLLGVHTTLTIIKGISHGHTVQKASMNLKVSREEKNKTRATNPCVWIVHRLGVHSSRDPTSKHGLTPSR